MEELEEYHDIVVKKLIDVIEKGTEMGLYYFELEEEIYTKLLTLFDEGQRIRTLKDGWCSYYVRLDNNKLLNFHYNNCDKMDTRATKFIFSIYPDADKCIVRYIPSREKYRNIIQVLDKRGHEIGEAGQSIDIDISLLGKVAFEDLVEPTSIEQIKERAKKGRTK